MNVYLRYAAISLGLMMGVFWMGIAPSPLSTPAQQVNVPHVAETQHTTLSLARGVVPAVSERFVTGIESLPASLQGTVVDGHFEVDAHGHLNVTAGVRQVFDYFLSAAGEEDQATLMARIRAYIRAQLQAPARLEAEQRLDQYVAYLAALKQLAPIQGDPLRALDEVRAQKRQVADLRLRFFDRQTSEAFFGAEDAYDQYTLARLEVINHPSLTPQQKSIQLKQITATLAPDLQEDVRTINQYQDLSALTQEWKAQAGNPQQLRHIREQIVGREAADRLERLDQDNAVWDQRIQRYLQQRDALRTQQGLDPVDQHKAIDLLKQQQFAAQEQVRVDALERIHDQGLSAAVQ